MTDATALLALSQLVCLGAVAYLYMEVQRLRKSAPRTPSAPAPRQVARRAARQAYAGAVPGPAAPQLDTYMSRVSVDIPALARRMNRSEDEVRALLRRQGVVR